MHKIFRYLKFSQTLKACPRNFSPLWDIKISTENRDKPPLIHNFFSIPEKIRKTEVFLHKAFRFGPVRQKISTKPWCPPPMHESFRQKKFSETPKCSQWNNLVQWDQNFDGNSWYPLLSINFFPYQKLSETQNGSLAKFVWFCEVKKNSGETVKLPPSFAWNFSIPEFFRNTEGFSYEFYRHCETKIFQRSLVICPSYAKNFRYPQLMKH